MTDSPTKGSAKEDTKIDVAFTTSKGFSQFLHELRASIALSTYQTGNLFLIGPDKDDTLAIAPTKLRRAMGLCVHENSLWVGGQFQIWRFNNILPPGVVHDGKDRVFIPQVAWTTADMDGHDIVREDSGRILFVNTLYSCLASLSDTSSFSHVWRPPVITELAPEDRCHLNGVAVRDGVARYVTAFSRHNTKQGWRENRAKQGVIWDIKTNALIAQGLTMPHSPRWYRDTLWCLESGSGRLGKIDLKHGTFIEVAQVPGYLRGLSFRGDFAFVGSSIPRDNSEIKDAGLEATLAKKGAVQTCGIFVVHLPSKRLVHSITISEGVQEIYDIAILPGTLRPWIYSIDAEEVTYMLNIS